MDPRGKRRTTISRRGAERREVDQRKEQGGGGCVLQRKLGLVVALDDGPVANIDRRGVGRDFDRLDDVDSESAGRQAFAKLRGGVDGRMRVTARRPGLD